MPRRPASLLALFALFFLDSPAAAQLAPEVGYVYPPGGKAGTTVAVQLGGAEWTPDMEFFVHDRRVKLEVLGPPGELLIPPPPDLGNIVVELEDVGVNVGTATSPRWLFRHLNLELRPGQCTGIVGHNGVGKTTLLKVCLGQLEPTEGTATVGKKVKVNYIDQTRMALDGTGSLLDEVADGNEKVQFGNQTMGARAYLRRFLFDDRRINERVDLLSGGERARLMLAKVLKDNSRDDEALEAVYLRTLARKPTAREKDKCLAYIKKVGSRSEAFEDILWALINSTEFQTKR